MNGVHLNSMKLHWLRAGQLSRALCRYAYHEPLPLILAEYWQLHRPMPDVRRARGAAAQKLAWQEARHKGVKQDILGIFRPSICVDI